MNKYIRTKDGKIIDLQKFIEEEKKSPYYTDHEFEEIKNEEDYCAIRWTAVGTKENNLEDQVGRRCHFSACANSPFIKQADDIEELIMVGDLIVWYNASSKRDEYLYIHDKKELDFVLYYPIKQVFTQTEDGREFKLVVAANDKGELELL